jgi:hypothetical protein
MDEEELAAAKLHFDCYAQGQQRNIPSGSLVIHRYSSLPFFKEQEEDLNLGGCGLINSYRQHRWIANLGSWTDPESVIGQYTPKTWTANQLHELPENMSFVLKGETNSKKFLWDTHCFAKDKKAAVQVYLNLMEDSMISIQEIYIRQYIPLKRLATSARGLPISKEFRFFCAYGEVLAGAFYWANHIEEGMEIPSTTEVPERFLSTINDYVKQSCNAYVLDVAQAENGDWILIEINDLTMSGIGLVDSNLMYSNLRQAISKNIY